MDNLQQGTDQLLIKHNREFYEADCAACGRTISPGIAPILYKNGEDDRPVCLNCLSDAAAEWLRRYQHMDVRARNESRFNSRGEKVRPVGRDF